MSAPSAPTSSRPSSYSCDGCGARVAFAPGTTSLRCPYCQHEQAIAPTRAIVEHPIEELAQRTPVALAAHTWKCEKCGATTESDGLATACQFCGAPLVSTSDAIAQIPPEAVLPFGVDRNGVRTHLRKWVASRWFAPGRFRTVSEAESLTGTYVPHWTYDADTRSDYTGERGTHYWVTETYNTTVDGETRTETRQVQRTSWSPTAGTVARAFDDVLVRGTTRLNDRHQRKLEPWPLEHAASYQPEYLAGFSALCYDIEPETGLEHAKQVMAKVIEGDCRNDIGGDEQRVHSVSTEYSDVMYKLMLLPVWLVAYVYAGKTWQVMVNGQTGEVIGDRPYSKWKIAGAILLAIAVIVAIIALFAR